MSVRLAAGETHDPARQETLRAHAGVLSHGLMARADAVGVLLSGSAVTGPVDAASDLDLQVVLDGGETLPFWTFTDEGIIENVHTLPFPILRKGLAARDNPFALARWFYRTFLGEELARCEVLGWKGDSPLLEEFLSLIGLRNHPDVIGHLTALHAQEAIRSVSAAREALSYGAVADSHQELRAAAQSLMRASLIDRGWILRGSKKQMEIAEAFLPDAGLEEVLALAHEVMGLDGLTAALAQEICRRRLRLRGLYDREKALLAGGSATQTDPRSGASDGCDAVHDSHSDNASDYYRSLVGNGFLRGPVNHIRALSGFPRIPRTLTEAAVGSRPRWPIQRFLQGDRFSDEIREEWSSVALLARRRETLLPWVSRFETLCTLPHRRRRFSVGYRQGVGRRMLAESVG